MIDPITVILWHFEKEVKQNQFLRYKAIPPDVVRFSYIRGYFVYCLFLLDLFISYIRGLFVYCPVLLVQFRAADFLGKLRWDRN